MWGKGPVQFLVQVSCFWLIPGSEFQFWFGPAEPVCDKGSVLLNQFWHRVELCWTKFCVHFGNPVWNRFRSAEQIWHRGSLQITAGLDFNPDGLSETQPYGFSLTGSAYWCDWLRIWGQAWWVGVHIKVRLIRFSPREVRPHEFEPTTGSVIWVWTLSMFSHLGRCHELLGSWARSFMPRHLITHIA